MCGYKWCHKQRGMILIKSSLFVRPCKNKDQKVITASASLDIKIYNFFFKRNLHLVIWDGVITPPCLYSLSAAVYLLCTVNAFIISCAFLPGCLSSGIDFLTLTKLKKKNVILFSSLGQTWKHFSKLLVVQKWEIKWRWSGVEMKLILVKGFTKRSGEFLVSFYSE